MSSLLKLVEANRADDTHLPLGKTVLAHTLYRPEDCEHEVPNQAKHPSRPENQVLRLYLLHLAQ